MAIYHFSVKTISRAAGHSATAAAAYRAGELLTDDRTGEKHDYRKRGGVECSTMHMPQGVATMPREQLWNKAEQAEKKINSCVARECEFALPHELNKKTQIALASQMAQYLADSYSVAVDASLHTPTVKNDARNTHAHLLMSTRSINKDGEFGAKTRILDAIKTGSPEISKWREHWANICNRELELAGFSERIDHRSLADQGVEKIPTIHVGHGQGAAQRFAINEEIASINNDLAADLKERAAMVAQEAIGAATTAAAQDAAQCLDQEEKTAQTPVKSVAFQDIAAAPLTPSEITALRQELAKPAPTRAELKTELAEVEKAVIKARQDLRNSLSTFDIDAAKKALPAATDDVQRAAKELTRIEDALLKVKWYQPFKKWRLEGELPEAQAAARAAREHEQETRTTANAADRVATYATQVAAQERAQELKTALKALPVAAPEQPQKRDAISNLLLKTGEQNGKKTDLHNKK